jgi:uncharacterized protein (DUF58 family)
MPFTHSRTTISLKMLVDLASQSRGLTFHHTRLHAKKTGEYLSKLKGRGMEFDETRLYQTGDDIRNIDWRVTARTGKTHTKIFREERERPIFISVDQRTTMHFATRGVFKSVLAAQIAALVAWTGQHHGDRIGGQLFFDVNCYEMKPQNGRQNVLRFLNAFIKSPITHEKTNNVNLEIIFKRLLRHTHPGSLVYIISDFRGFTPSAQTQLIQLAKRCDVVLIFIYDSLEQHLPSQGKYRFIQQEQDVLIDSSDKHYQHAYQQRFDEKWQIIQGFAQQHKLIFLSMSTQGSPLDIFKHSVTPTTDANGLTRHALN